MKKIRVYILFTLLIMLAFITNVSAEEKCTYSKRTDLGELALNVQVDSQYLREVVEDPTHEYANEFGEVVYLNYEFTIYNLPSSFYVEMTNNLNSEKKTFDYNDVVDNKIVYKTEYTGEVVNYAFEIFAGEGECKGQSIRTIKITTPRYNQYYDLEMCSDIPDFYLCQQFTTSTYDVSYDTFFTKAEAYKKGIEQNKTEDDKEKEKKSKTFKYILLTVGIVAAGGVTTFIVIKKKRGKVF